MHINMTTFAARDCHYIDRTLESLFDTYDSPDLSLALIMGSEDQSHVQRYANHPAIRIVPWDIESHPRLRINCTLNKIRALRYGDSETMLICEDDIEFQPGWFSALQAAAAEMRDEEYVMTLSLPEEAEIMRPLRGKKLVRKYPKFVLNGAQALYYPNRSVRTQAADYLTRHLFKGCGDDLLGRFARSYAALYATTQQLVTHKGAISCFEPVEL